VKLVWIFVQYLCTYKYVLICWTKNVESTGTFVLQYYCTVSLLKDYLWRVGDGRFIYTTYLYIVLHCMSICYGTIITVQIILLEITIQECCPITVSKVLVYLYTIQYMKRSICNYILQYYCSVALQKEYL
jgi:hypothetical protein